MDYLNNPIVVSTVMSFLGNRAVHNPALLGSLLITLLSPRSIGTTTTDINNPNVTHHNIRHYLGIRLSAPKGNEEKLHLTFINNAFAIGVGTVAPC